MRVSLAGVEIRIVGTRLPGRCFEEFDNVHVGIQRAKDVVDRQPGDSAEVRFEFEVTVVQTPGGADFRGPYVHGVRGARFLYLSWGNLTPDGSWSMFRRAKLPLRDVPSAAAIATAVELTDTRGGPRCATVPVDWRPVRG